MSTAAPPSAFIGTYPPASAGGTADLFPPVCLRSHWDPTQMLRHILPQQQVALPQDFRPLVKMCRGPTAAPGRVLGALKGDKRVEGPMEYVTSGPAVSSPMPPNSMVFPTGGTFYPPGRYAAAVDTESVLRTLDRRLNRDCLTADYIPSLSSTLYDDSRTLPDRTARRTITELEMPQALLRLNGETCRSSNDSAYFERSGRLFNNPTKQDRYGAEKFYAKAGGLPRGEPMPHGGVFRPSHTAQAMASARLAGGTFSQPGGASAIRVRGVKSPVSRDGTFAVGVTTAGSAAPVW
jgi:hypothetical protein